MIVQRMSCASCGASITIPSDIDTLNCAYCGSSLVVERGEGYATLKLAEKVSKAIDESGAKTQAEIKRMALMQEQGTREIQLTNLEGEIRSLERSKLDRTGRKQLKSLYQQRQALQTRIRDIQMVLYPPVQVQVGAAGAAKASATRAANVATSQAHPTTGWPIMLKVLLGAFVVWPVLWFILVLPAGLLVNTNSQLLVRFSGAWHLVAIVLSAIITIDIFRPGHPLWNRLKARLRRKPQVGQGAS
jgi:DNA-directed RNA polymerase subunit RPC12/RpoP